MPRRCFEKRRKVSYVLIFLCRLVQINRNRFLVQMSLFGNIFTLSNYPNHLFFCIKIKIYQGILDNILIISVYLYLSQNWQINISVGLQFI